MRFKNLTAGLQVAKATIIKYSPEILMGLGAVSFVSTIVVASKETVKEQEILDDHEETLAYVQKAYEYPEDLEYVMDEKAYKKSRRCVYIDTIKRTSINYAPAVILGATSLTCFFGAFGIMKKRYTTLVVAYTALEESFRRYRERVVAEQGAEADLRYLTGAETKEITVKDDDGKKHKVKRLVLPDGSIASPYAFKFSKYKENGEINKQWSDNPLMNRSYVYGQIDYLNNQLMYERTVYDHNHRVKVRGWVFLNELRELMGEDGNTTGSVVGNMLGNGEPGCNGYINPKITEITEKETILDFDGNPVEKDIHTMIIDPNVDGLIYDLIGKPEKEPFELVGTIFHDD